MGRLLRDADVIVRKRHQCSLCLLHIPSGMRCRSYAGVEDGRDFYHGYEHLGCAQRALYEWTGLEDEWGLDPDETVLVIQAWCGPWIDSLELVP